MRLFLALLVCSLASTALADPQPATLRWLDGEQMGGYFISATGTDASWKSPYFDEPVILDWATIHRVDWPVNPAPGDKPVVQPAVQPGLMGPITFGGRMVEKAAVQPPVDESLFFYDSVPGDWMEDFAQPEAGLSGPGASVEIPDSFLFSMRDGSALRGSLVAVTGSSVFIRGTRYGQVELKRSQVLSARRVQGDDLIFAGPTGDAGWQEMTENQDGSFGSSSDNVSAGKMSFATGPGGALSFPYWDRAAMLHVDLPGAVDVEFHVHAPGRPDFRVSIGDGSRQAMAIETWYDQIVLTDSNQYKFVRNVEKTEHDFAFRLCWDPKTRHCQLFTPGGQLLTDWQVPALAAPPEAQASPAPHRRLVVGFPVKSRHPRAKSSPSASPADFLLVQNKARALSLDFLRIRKWNGKPPPVLDAASPHVELSDGRVVNGEIASGTAGALLVTGTGAVPADLAIDSVDAIVFSTAVPQPAAAQAIVTYADGTWLAGKISAIRNGVLTLATSFTVQPLAARMDAPRQLLVANAPASKAPSLDKMDVLDIGDETFHGALSSGTDGLLRWLPIGALQPVPLSKEFAYDIERTLPDNSKFSASPALFYTRSGDVLPGTLRSMDRAGAEIDSPITKLTRLPANNLEAIQFDSPTRVRLNGFNDPGWRILKGDKGQIHKAGNSITMNEGSSIGHPEASQNGVICFEVPTGGFCSGRLRFFCAGTDPGKSFNFLFAVMGGTLYCGPEASEGQMNDQFQTNISSARIRMVIKDSALDLYVNGGLVKTYSLSGAMRGGSGLIVEPASLWGNGVNPLTLNNFSVVSDLGSVWLPDVAPDAKTQALTIPRFRRDDPPAHALIAENGDVLRGEIEAATATSFGFRTGMDEVVVPRDRVKAVIWLSKPVDPTASPASGPQAATRQRLKEEMNGNFQLRRATLAVAINYVKTSYPELKFEIPPDKRRLTVQIEPDSIGGVINTICGRFGMRYHVDTDGVIVIQPYGAASPRGSLVEKTYWLKPGTFGPADAPASILAAKGAPFPRNATATWDPDVALLRVINTPQNQARVARVLNADFGGVLGSPTHWLLLASGARIGLAVDRFGKDRIEGWHPIYGRCSIPTADVLTIRTAPATPSAVMSAVSDWRLVYAPEPVLPTAGGDSSLLIGKPARDFQLALLDGSRFALSAQKGKVVVLDFWATWCGPCVRSLPDLIAAMSAFPPDRVAFVGVDQDEPPGQVKQFLETRGWKLTAALDPGQTVGQQYGADVIPHTVVIAPDGTVAWVKNGYSPDGAAEVAKEVTLLLAPH